VVTLALRTDHAARTAEVAEAKEQATEPAQTWKLSSSLQLSLWHSGLPQRHPTGFMDAL
jgi:hypothetical protein